MAVFRAGALGDFLLGIPALAALRRHFRSAHVTLAGPLPASRFAIAMGLADDLVAIDDPRIAPLFGERPGAERVIPPLRDLDAGVVWLSQAESVAGHLRSAGAARVVAAPPFGRAGGAPHVADWLLATLEPLAVRAEPDWDATPWLALDADGAAWAADWHGRELGGAPFLVLHPGSGSARKNWHAPGWAEVVFRLTAMARMKLVITAGPADAQPLADLLAALRETGNEPVVIQQPDLFHLAGVVGRAALYLGNDSGVTHLAAGLGTPTVAVFGPTNPQVWRPRGPRVLVLGGNHAAGLGEAPLIAEDANWPDVAAVTAAAAALTQAE